jgi:hypothetical protein
MALQLVGNKIGLTAWGFTVIDKRFLITVIFTSFFLLSKTFLYFYSCLKIIATISTYLIVLLQFRAGKPMFCFKNVTLFVNQTNATRVAWNFVN